MVPMEVKNMTTPPDEAFVVEAIILLERVSIEATNIANPPKGMVGATSPLTIGLYIEMIGITSLPATDPHARMIDTMSLLAGKPCMP